MNRIKHQSARSGRIATTALKSVPVALLLASFTAQAQTITWAGAGTNNNWDTAANWLSGEPPAAGAPPINLDATPEIEGGTADLIYTGAPARSSSAMRGNYSVNSITYDAALIVATSITTASPGSLAQTRADLTVGAGGITSNVTTFNLTIQQSTTAGTLRGDLILGAPQTWSLNAPEASSSAITFSINRKIVGPHTVTKTGTGVLVIAINELNDTWTGDINLVQGSIRLGGATDVNRQNLGSGKLISESSNNVSITASTVSSAGGGGNRILDNDMQLGGTGQLSLAGTFNFTFTGNSNWEMTGQKLLAANTVTNHNGTISGNFGFDKVGGGMLVLNSANSYDGPTNVVTGILRLTNSSALGVGTDGASVAALTDLNPVGGQLELQNDITISDMPLSIAGNGFLYTPGSTVNPELDGQSFKGALRNRSGNNTWTGAVSLTADATINVEAGSLSLPGGFNGTGNLTKTGTGPLLHDGTGVLLGDFLLTQGSVTVGGTQTFDRVVASAGTSIEINGALTLAGDGTPAETSVLTNTALTFSDSGSLDTTVNDLIIDYTGTSPLADIQTLQLNGQLLAAPDFGGVSTVMVLFEAADLGFTEFNGVTVDADTIIGKYTYSGDANLDGQVDAFDYGIVDSFFGNPGSFVTGDLNQDGVVDAFDYASIDDTFGAGIGSPLRPSAITETFIPEPSSLGLLAMAGGLLARRRR